MLRGGEGWSSADPLGLASGTDSSSASVPSAPIGMSRSASTPAGTSIRTMLPTASSNEARRDAPANRPKASKTFAPISSRWGHVRRKAGTPPKRSFEWDCDGALTESGLSAGLSTGPSAGASDTTCRLPVAFQPSRPPTVRHGGDLACGQWPKRLPPPLTHPPEPQWV